MDNKIFSDTKKRIVRYVAENRLRDAFALTRSLAAGIQNHPLADRVAGTEEGYRYMLEYASRGADDPARGEMTRHFGETVLEIVDCLERENLRTDTPTCYFNTLRYEAMQTADTIASLLDTYRSASTQGSLFEMVASGGTHSTKSQQALAECEALERRIFNRIWVTHPLSTADAEAIGRALDPAGLPSHFREMTVSAITLGGLQYHDERRIELLLDAYGAADDRVSTAAFIGLMLLLHSARKRRFSEKLRNRLTLCNDSPEWQRDLRTAYMELAKTIDTDRITRKIRDEVVPEMLKLRPEIDSKLNSGIENLDSAELDENPEWHEMLEKSGIADKLKEMSEIQEEGGDVMMGTFAHLKSFPFFNEPANWFLPFHCERSEFSGADSAMMQPVAELIGTAPFLCDSDKYSFMFSLAHVPAMQRDMMLSQFKAQESQLAAIKAASLETGESGRKNAFNKQVQNLYRFYRLFRRKGEFNNPFESGVNLIEVGMLRTPVLRMGILPLVAEFYFSHGYYSQALEAFRILESETGADAQLYQKIGFALQKSGNLTEAVDYYLKAEMLDGRSDWTLRRLVRCLMALNRPAEALERLEELGRRHPEHVATALNTGRCLVELERYDEAIAAYYKAEYLDSKSNKALRPLAWCLFLTGNLERSRKYYEKIVADSTPTSADYLNMGHLALAEKRVREALNFYSLNITARIQERGDGKSAPASATAQAAQAAAQRQEAIDGFIADMRADTPSLLKAGVDPTLIPLLVDSILYDI